MKANIFKYIFIIFIISIVSFALYNIYFKSSEQEEETKIENEQEEIIESKDLRLAISNYDTINPILTQNKEVINLDKLIYEPLITIDKNYKKQLCLAKECNQTSPTTYVIKVNTSVKWHGKEINLTAKDVQFTIEKLKERKSIYSANVQKISQVEAVDSETVAITLIEEVPFFEYNLTFPIICSQDYIEEDFYTSTKIPVGTRYV